MNSGEEEDSEKHLVFVSGELSRRSLTEGSFRVEKEGTASSTEQVLYMKEGCCKILSLSTTAIIVSPSVLLRY